MNLRRRGALVGVAAVLVAAELAAAAAFACGNIATLQLAPPNGTAGTRVTATGSSYSVQHPALPVVLHWNGVDGPELGRATPDDRGNISVAFTVPAAAPASTW